MHPTHKACDWPKSRKICMVFCAGKPHRKKNCSCWKQQYWGIIMQNRGLNEKYIAVILGFVLIVLSERKNAPHLPANTYKQAPPANTHIHTHAHSGGARHWAQGMSGSLRRRMWYSDCVTPSTSIFSWVISMAVTVVLVNCSRGPRYQLRMKQMLLRWGFAPPCCKGPRVCSEWRQECVCLAYFPVPSQDM